MKAGLTKISILALVAVAVLATGTVLVWGYVDKPDRAAQVLAEDQCGGCPMQGTDACGKVADPGEGQACPVLGAEQTAEEEKPAGCCPQAKEADSPMVCPMHAAGCTRPE